MVGCAGFDLSEEKMQSGARLGVNRVINLW